MTNANIEDEGVVIQERFDCSKEELWETITDVDELSAWLGGACTLEPRVGGAVRLELPDEGITARGVIREWNPPDPSRSLAGFEHTFIDDAAPDVLSVCRWSLIPVGNGCDLRFTLQSVDDAPPSSVAGQGGRLSEVMTGAVAERPTTSVDTALEVLGSAKEILLVSWVTPEIPRVLVEAGFSVVSKNGPEPDNYGRATVDAGHVRFIPVKPPTHADLLHLDWTIGFHEYLELAKAIGVHTFWYHSARTRPPAPADVSGCWLPARKSVRLRAVVEAAGMTYIDNHYIVEVARLLGRHKSA